MQDSLVPLLEGAAISRETVPPASASMFAAGRGKLSIVCCS